MNIQAEKIELVKMLFETDNPKIIESIKKIFKKQKSIDFWDDLSVNQQKEIENAIKIFSEIILKISIFMKLIK